MFRASNLIKIIVLLFVVIVAVVLSVKFQNGDSVVLSEGGSELSPAYLKNRHFEKLDISGEFDESENLEVRSHRSIARKHAKMDRIVLGDTSYVDSRASRRISENRMLAVIEPTKGLSARQRVNAMRGLSALRLDEQSTLYSAILRDELPEGVSRPAWNWMVDVMMTTLRTQGADSATMVVKFSEIAHAQRVDYTVRDYALQHLGHLKGEGADSVAIDNTLIAALPVKEATIAGTALLALDNSLESGNLTDEELAQRADRAAAIASDPSYSLESRVTALQVAARHQPESVEQLAQQIVAQDDSPEILKLSAQAALTILNN